MPTLQRLMDAGISGTLKSTMPPWTPTAWASIVTGKNPGKHGVFDMMFRRPGEYEFSPTNASTRNGSPFWKYLNRRGLQVGLVNVPFTYPPSHLDGFAVSGFGTPSSVSDFAYPPELSPWIEQEYGKFEPVVSAQFLRRSTPKEILEKEKWHQRQMVQLAIELAERFQVEILAINLMLPDHANHKMPQMEQVRDAYRWSDSDLDALVRAYRPDNVMLISDHGSSRLKGDFLLDAWLRDQGYYIEAKSLPLERAAALNWLLIQWLQYDHGWSGRPEKIARRMLKDMLLTLPDKLTDGIWSRLDKIMPNAREYVLLSGRPDHSRTLLYPGSVYSGLLYFNLTGREPTGVLSSEDRYKLATEIATKLRQIEEPETRQPLFGNVYTSEELYRGPAAEHGPDLIIDSYDGGWNTRTVRYSSIPGPVRNKYFVDAANGIDFGWHSRDGIYVFSGPAFGKGFSSCKGNVMDVPATLLHLHGVPVPDDYDGRVLAELLAPELGEQQIEFQPGDRVDKGSLDGSYSSDEAEEVMNHLRALGYLD